MEYCPWEAFRAQCLHDEVLVMETAKYGRMRLGRCVKNDLGYVGCFTDVLDLADGWCSGRQSCEIAIPNPDLDNLKPCLEDLKSYFEVTYKCIKGKPHTLFNIVILILVAGKPQTINTTALI